MTMQITETITYKCPRCEILLDQQLVCPECKQDFSTDIAYNKKGELSPAQISCQDETDSIIGECLGHFVDNPYDVELTGPVKDAITDILVADGAIKSEWDIYPWILEPEAEEPIVITPENNEFTKWDIPESVKTLIAVALKTEVIENIDLLALGVKHKTNWKALTQEIVEYAFANIHSNNGEAHKMIVPYADKIFEELS